MSDGVFFLTIFFFLFVAWVAGGGPAHPISFAGPFIAPSVVAPLQTGYVPGGSGAAESSLWQYSQQLSDLQKEANKAQLFGDPSPYRGKVTLSNGNAAATDPAQQYLYIRNASAESVTISGWRLASAATDDSAVIPRGDPLPSNGYASARQPITLAPGQQAIVSTGKSPLGASFLENKCIGYLDRSRSYVPYLSQQCPSAREEFDRYFTGNPYKDTRCYEAVQNLNTCQIPAVRSNFSSACTTFIDQRLSYPGCVATHQYDPDFTRYATWRVYLNYHDPHAKNKTVNDPLWKTSREAIKLLDQNGKTVDLYTY